jgi:small-conductance mechanosensitive channel
MGMRATWLRDEVGRMIVISNGDISIVINHSRGALTTSVEVGVAPGSDLDQVCGILRDVGSQFAKGRDGVLAPFTCDGVAAMDGTKVTLRLVGEVHPRVQQQVQLDLRRRVRDALVEKDIQIA